jgi:hypothetical protein
MQQPIVDLLVWMRVPGDTIFSHRRAALRGAGIAAAAERLQRVPSQCCGGCGG